MLHPQDIYFYNWKFVYLSSSVWLISLNHMPSGSFHVFRKWQYLIFSYGLTHFVYNTQWVWTHWGYYYNTSCEELTHWKRLWCCEGLGAGGEGDDRGWDGWMASLTRWTWVWVNSRSWWWTGRPGMLQFMGSQRVGHDWATDLIWIILWINWCTIRPVVFVK